MKKLILILAALVATTNLLWSQSNGSDRGATIMNESDYEGEPVFVEVEHAPEFPGGIEALMQYLSTNIKYPTAAKEAKISGRVFVQFVVEKDGKVSNIRVLRSPDQLLADEAERVVKAMPRWKPGKHAGKPVRVQFNLPINFTLQ